jgi:predicted transposase YbfD/YdcC
METGENNLFYYFKEVEDPRAENRSHLLEDLFTITLLAVICGCEDWEDISLYAECKVGFLKTFLKLPNGIPSPDTFERLFKKIDSNQFEKCFIKWVEHLCNQANKGLISIDGKTLRGCSNKGGSKSAIHMVSAWSNENQMVLGQFKVEAKTNEITAIPALLDLLDISGSIITIDAMGCQKDIALKIIDNGADYILALKGNQGSLKEEVENAFKQCPANSVNKTTEKDHGRIEIRECSIINDMDWIFESQNWKGLQSIIKIKSTRIIKDNTETETRFYISSLNIDAKEINPLVRGHWGIENSLHWVLDVIFNEDYCRKRTGNSAENFSIVRKMALNLVRKETSKKMSINKKRLKASLDDDYLIKLIAS